MSEELLRKNLANKPEPEYDLFGNKIEILSMKDRIGFIPVSIWQPDWSKTKELKGIIGDFGQTRAMDSKSGNARTAGASYKENMGGAANSMSIFNPCLAQMILSAYCPPRAEIYDPFGGGGTRGFVAAAMGHKYFGVELRSEECERIKTKMIELDRNFELQEGDSRYFPPFPEYENHFDFCYTCPPYYDLEIYSDLPDDLSAAKTYEDFLSMARPIMENIYKALKTGALAVWVVGNFRDKRGALVHFSGDIVRLGEAAGFKLHDELIFWGASGQAAQRAGAFEANRKSVRVHEYIIILRKE